jgi:hypothetical protein
MPRSLTCEIKKHKHSHHKSAGINRRSLRIGFTGLFRETYPAVNASGKGADAPEQFRNYPVDIRVMSTYLVPWCSDSA